MRIVHLTPGAGENFYCENCLRDSSLLSAMKAQGHDVLMVPLYLPAYGDKPLEVDRSPIFFGGINVWLQQHSGLFRKTPRWLDKVLDSPRLLRCAARNIGLTSAKELGETTASMLAGPQGRQAKELDRLIEWLTEQDRPDVVVLSNALLTGLAASITRRLDVPVVCGLQDEHGFLDGLPERYRRDCWKMLHDNARYVQAFFAPNRWYAELMRSRLELSDVPLYVVYNGIDLYGLGPAESPPERPTIGFLSQLSEMKGFDTLVEAFCVLKGDGELGELQLAASGGQLANDRKMMARVENMLGDYGYAESVQIHPEFDRKAKRDMLARCTVLSVPCRHDEAAGLFVLESLACGVPVVLPRRGAFPELIECTGGGLLYQPGDSAELVGKLKTVLTDADLAQRLGQAGRAAVAEQFDVRRQADELTGLLDRACKEYRS
jgi:glycosyltransferase involved in cell wall biosynthesis